MQNDPLWIREQLKVASSTVLKQDESKTCNRMKTNIFKPITKTEFDHTWLLLYKRVRKRHFFLIYFNWMETKLRIFKSMFRSSLYGSSESQNLDVLIINFWPVTLLLSFQHKDDTMTQMTNLGNFVDMWVLHYNMPRRKQCCYIFAMSLFLQMFLSPVCDKNIFKHLYNLTSL